MKSKLLSISVAAYNVEKYIETLIEIIICTKNKDFIEVFIVDDGGWGSTINYTIKIANGKYFKQLDGDDYYDSNGLDSLVSFLSNSSSDLVYTPFVEFEDGQFTNQKNHFLNDGFELKYDGTQYSIDECTMAFEHIAMHSCTFILDRGCVVI